MCHFTKLEINVLGKELIRRSPTSALVLSDNSLLVNICRELNKFAVSINCPGLILEANTNA